MIFKAELLFSCGTWRWQTAAKTVCDFHVGRRELFAVKTLEAARIASSGFDGRFFSPNDEIFCCCFTSIFVKTGKAKAFLAWKYLHGADYESIIQSLAALRDLKIDACAFSNKRFSSSFSLSFLNFTRRRFLMTRKFVGEKFECLHNSHSYVDAEKSWPF